MDTEATPASTRDLSALPPDGQTSARTGAAHFGRHVCQFARAALIAYLVLLFVLAFAHSGREAVVRLEDFVQVRDGIVKVLTAALTVFVQFGVLGLLVALSAGPHAAPLSRSRRLAGGISMLLVGAVLFTLLSLVESGRMPGALAPICPFVGYVLGLWIGRACLWGGRAFGRSMLGLVAVLLVLGATAVGAWRLAIDSNPLPFQPPKVTSAEKRRLADLLEHSYRGNGLRQLRLTQHDVNLLLAMGMPQVFPLGKAQVALGEKTACGELSIGLGNDGAQQRWLNVRATCLAAITAGHLEIRCVECRVGRLSVPRFLLDVISPWLIAEVLADPDVQQVLAAINSVRLEPGVLEAVVTTGDLGDGSGRLSETVIPSLIARLGQKPDMAVRTQVYIRYLVATAKHFPVEGRFEAFLQAAFDLARRRSTVEDPVLENRAAILALAVLLGHPRVETLIGPVTDQELRAMAKQNVGRVTLRDRRDWCQHFLVSAALALTLNQSLSDEAGVTKEELDAGSGGSGFSFADYLADRAGTLFALAATRDDQSARRMQDRLASRPNVDDLFPPAADLPEGIPDAILQRDYGGVKGQRSNQVIAEIERRLARCPGLW